MPTEFALKRPIDGSTLALIREVHIAATSLGHQPLLVGATARVILVEHVFGLPAGRQTRDVDFAFALSNWEQFEALRQRLIDHHGFQVDTRLNNRLLYQSPGSTIGLPVDLLPFGQLGGDQEEIRWPPDMTIVMDMAGFSDAYDCAVSVELAAGLRLAIASLPSIAILKLFSWRARGDETPKDAADLTGLMRLYHEVDADRIYAVPDVLERADFDIELAGAWLLGSDARQSVHAATAAKLATLFDDAAEAQRLSHHMARSLGVKSDAEAYAAKLLTQFIDGFGTVAAA